MNIDEPSVEDTHVDATPAAVEIETPPKEPSRLGLFFKRILRWAAGIGLLFAFGVMLTWIVRVRPLVRELRDVRSDLTAASAHIEDLEEQVSGMEALEESYASLEADLNDAELHLSLLGILSDVNAARLALAMDNLSAARTALSDTDERLSMLQKELEDEYANTVAGARFRLQQAISEISTNVFAAMGDLEILANDLMNLESEYFDD
jgi:chromosome segregation ATPase